MSLNKLSVCIRSCNGGHRCTLLNVLKDCVCVHCCSCGRQKLKTMMPKQRLPTKALLCVECLATLLTMIGWLNCAEL